MFFFKRSKNYNPFFSKNTCYLIGDLALIQTQGEAGDIADFSDIEFENISWETFGDSFLKDMVVILINPPVNNTQFSEYRALVQKDLGSIRMRLIIITNDQQWKDNSVLYYVYVLPFNTKWQELKRLYFQLSSYFIPTKFNF